MSMKNVILAGALISSSAQAFDFREEHSEGYKPNVQTVQEDRAYYGIEQSDSECQRAAMRVIGAKLKDPYSARYQFTKCEKNYFKRGDNYWFGYHIGGAVNSKNGYGGYAGQTGFEVIIQDGRVIAECMASQGRIECPSRYWAVDKSYGKNLDIRSIEVIEYQQ